MRLTPSVTNPMTLTHPETLMSSRTRSTSPAAQLPTFDPDLDLDGSAGLPPDDLPPPAAVEAPEPDPTPPSFMVSQAERVCAELPHYPTGRLPTLRWNVVRAMSDAYPTLDVPDAAIRAAFRNAAPIALGFINVGQAEVNSVYAWLDATATEVIASRTSCVSAAQRRQEEEEEAERDRLWRIENAEKLAKAAKAAEYREWLAANPDAVAHAAVGVS
jgi:hypothetical protein